MNCGFVFYYPDASFPLSPILSAPYLIKPRLVFCYSGNRDSYFILLCPGGRSSMRLGAEYFPEGQASEFSALGGISLGGSTRHPYRGAQDE